MRQDAENCPKNHARRLSGWLTTWLIRRAPIAVGLLVSNVLHASALPALDQHCWGQNRTPRLLPILQPSNNTATLIYVHGYKDEPAAFNAIYLRMRQNQAIAPRAAHYVLCFDDQNNRVPDNATAFADLLANIRRADPRKSIVFITHSLGGIITRSALNTLTAKHPAFFQGGSVTHLAIDTPWHGFDGPSDEGGDKILLWFAKPFLPDGIFDMRAKSRFFRGLYHVQLPRHVAIYPIFAQSGDQALDYTEAPFNGLASHLAAAFNAGANPYTLIKEERFRHFWSALVQSVPGRTMYHALMAAGARGNLTADQVLQTLHRSFPRYAGDHRGVLFPDSGRAPAGETALDWAEASVSNAL